MSWRDRVGIKALIGKTLVSVVRGMGVEGEQITFVTNEGDVYAMFHYQDCCESVYVEDICGELDWLVGSPILDAYESSNRDDPPPHEYHDESRTWTFYVIRTMKGTVTIRWYGESNGYYSEDVEFELQPQDAEAN